MTYKAERIYKDGFGNLVTQAVIDAAKSRHTYFNTVRAGFGVVDSDGHILEHYDQLKTAKMAADWYNRKMAVPEEQQYVSVN